MPDDGVISYFVPANGLTRGCFPKVCEMQQSGFHLVQSPCTELKYQNLCDMLARLSPQLFRRDAVWLIHPSTLPELLSLVIGSNESFYPVLSESSGQLRMLALPVQITEHCQVLGDQGDVILCAPREYALGVRKDISIDRSQHVNFQTDEMTWRIQGRFAGSGTWKSAYTPRIGSDTLSWCVTLDSRA